MIGGSAGRMLETSKTVFIRRHGFSEAGFQSPSNVCRICGGQIGNVVFFIIAFKIPLPVIITSVLHIHLLRSDTMGPS